MAKARQENGNEKRLLISVRLVLCSRVVFAFQLLEQLLNGQRGTVRLSLFSFIELVQTDRQRAFRHVDAVADSPKIGRVFFIALLITRVIKMHEDALVFQVGLDPPRCARRSLASASEFSSISKTMMFSSMFPSFLPT